VPEYTVKQYAMREQVTVPTVRAWIKRGALEIRRTPGNHYRIVVERDDDARSDDSSTPDRAPSTRVSAPTRPT